MKQPCVANLHNVMTVNRGSLGRVVARLSARRMQEVCTALVFAIGCEG
jgi:mRNA-degrading endonuclease toxin of MazEF toxin-antitoxin module